MKVLQYFKLWTEKELIDPTPNKMWLGNKAKLMGLTLKKENLKNLPNSSEDFVCFITVKKVKKHCRRGEQLLEENFIDIGSIYQNSQTHYFAWKEYMLQA